MADIRIPPHCAHCKPQGGEDGAPFPYPHREGHVLTRIAWTGHHRETGQPMIEWEGQAGQVPSQVEFPTVNFMPTACWCPVCLVMYRIGRVHPVEEKAAQEAKDAAGPRLVKP